MRLMKKTWIIPIVLTILILIGSQLYTDRLFSGEETKTEKEVQTQLEKMYFGGKVDHISRENSIYKAEITREGSQYEVKVDGKTGEILKLTQTKKADLALTEQGSPIATANPAKQQEKSVRTGKPPVEKEPVPSVTKKENVKKTDPAPPVKAIKKTVHISEQQAIKIALQKLNGEVNDVDYVATNRGGYYLVEIEIDVEDGPDEATYQIHAISGKIMTVTWED